MVYDRLIKTAWLGMLLFILNACTTKGPVVDYDPDFLSTNLRSFSIHPESTTLASIDGQRLEKALIDTLKKKGYRLQQERSDFVLAFKASVEHDIPSRVSFGIGLGSFGWHGVGGGISANVTPTHDEIVVQVTMVEPRHRKVFWSATERKEFSSFKTPKEREVYFEKLAEELLQSFPKTQHP